MSAILTELDYALNVAQNEIDTTNARAELAQLRSAADERDEARILSGVIDSVTLSEWIYEELELSLNARIERDELKAQLQAANERSDLMSRTAHANA